MSSKCIESGFQRRTSERRRLKMLKNLNEYKIENPFRSMKELPTFPHELSEQLQRMDFLSATTISMLSFDTYFSKDATEECLLFKMKEANLQQSVKYGLHFDSEHEITAENYENEEEESVASL
jgi:hypothetical protein